VFGSSAVRFADDGCAIMIDCQVNLSFFATLQKKGDNLWLLTHNDQWRVRESDRDDPTALLYLLQEQHNNRSKFGLCLGQCGACTVLLDGNHPVLYHQRIGCGWPQFLTLEARHSANPHPFRGLHFQQAMQCGMPERAVLYGKAYIDANPGATRIRFWRLWGNASAVPLHATTEC